MGLRASGFDHDFGRGSGEGMYWGGIHRVSLVGRRSGGKHWERRKTRTFKGGEQVIERMTHQEPTDVVLAK